jgi:deazaflavin-dependent oxidoreductase (nitroreductase family)
VPMPRWWTRINKRVFNPMELRRGVRPVLTHVGRSSGTTYRTPLDAHPVEGGYVFVLVYGSRSDWVRNTLAAGHARLTVDGQDVELTAPRVIAGPEPTRRGRPSVTASSGLPRALDRITRVPADGPRRPR